MWSEKLTLLWLLSNGLWLLMLLSQYLCSVYSVDKSCISVCEWVQWDSLASVTMILGILLCLPLNSFCSLRSLSPQYEGFQGGLLFLLSASSLATFSLTSSQVLENLLSDSQSIPTPYIGQS